jgi:subtilase family serine protease
MRTFAVLSWAAWLAIAVLTMAVGVYAFGCAGNNGDEAGGNHAARLQGLHPTGEDLNAFKPAPSDKEIALELSFAMQHKDQFDELTRETQNPGSKQYQHWLTPEEMHARFGESRAQFDAVEQWLSYQGFTIVEKSYGSNEDYIKFKGAIGQVEKAFKIEIVSPQFDRYANKEDPAIPPQFVGVISSITGLSGEIY